MGRIGRNIQIRGLVPDLVEASFDTFVKTLIMSVIVFVVFKDAVYNWKFLISVIGATWAAFPMYNFWRKLKDE